MSQDAKQQREAIRQEFKEREQKQQQASARAVAEQALPDAVLDGFECPITQDIMEDPVMTLDGHSYDRRAIEAWFATGRNKSPVTGAVLPSRALIPNHNLRKAIQHYLKQQPALAHLKQSERTAKSQEQVLKDLMIAIELREQDLQRLAEKTAQIPTASASQEQLKEDAVDFVRALDQFLKSGPNHSQFFASAAAGYASTVISCFRKPPEELTALLEESELYSLPKTVAQFVSKYLAQHPNLHLLRKYPDLANNLKKELCQSGELNVLLQKCMAIPVAEQKESKESKAAAGSTVVNNGVNVVASSSSSTSTSTSSPSQPLSRSF